MSDRLPQLEEQFSEASSEFSFWTSFMETAGWQRLKQIAEGQVNERGKQVLRTPLSNMDGALAQEFMKGEAAGIELFVQIPEVCITQAKSDMESLQKEIDNETTSSVDDGGSGGGSNSGGSDEPELFEPGRSAFGE